MKVAVLSPAVWRTPPLKYGPWEQVASNIAEGLLKKGVDVTLFATADSLTCGKLKAVIEKPYGENPEMDAKVSECLHISHLMEKAGDFDIIHNNYDFLPLTYSRLIKPPIVTTIHGFSSPKIIPVYKKYNDTSYYVSISDSDRSPELVYTATVYNGINENEFTFREKRGSYLLYFGRIHHDKWTFESIQIAKKARIRLIISGLIQDESYYNEKVKPYVDGENVIYVGNSGPEKRDKLLGEALALLHPVNFDEPFGLSVVEAFFCGTPVIAYDRGAMKELILHGETGFLVNSIDEAAEAVQSINRLCRRDIRNYAMSKFTREIMAEKYISIYGQVLRR